MHDQTCLNHIVCFTHLSLILIYSSDMNHRGKCTMWQWGIFEKNMNCQSQHGCVKLRSCHTWNVETHFRHATPSFPNVVFNTTSMSGMGSGNENVVNTQQCDNTSVHDRAQSRKVQRWHTDLNPRDEHPFILRLSCDYHAVTVQQPKSPPEMA